MLCLSSSPVFGPRLMQSCSQAAPHPMWPLGCPVKLTKL